MQKTHRFRGAKISYSLAGKGRCIVLIHGFLGSGDCWDEIANRLKENFKVLTLDLPGHGNSEAMAYVHHMEDLADLIKSLLHELNIRKAVLVGHSMGGYVTLAFGEKYPDLIKGLVLINSTAAADSAKRIKSRNQLIQLVKKDKAKSISALIPSFFNEESKNRKKLMAYYKRQALKCSTQGIIASIEGMKIRKEREIVLKFAPYPYLIIIGKKDAILDEKQLKMEASLGENSQHLVLEDSAHMSYLEEPGKVFKTLKEFARSL